MHFVQPARVWKSGFDHCQPICRLVTARASDRPHGNYISSMSNSAHLKKKLATITDVLCVSYFSFILKHVKQGSKRVKDLRSRALSDLKRSWALETSAALGPKALELGRSPAPAISLNLIEPSNRSLTHKCKPGSRKVTQ